MHITIPLESEFKRSKSGKALIVASTRGFVNSEAVVHGKKVAVSLNATIKPD